MNNLNVDEIKEELFRVKKYMNIELSKEEEEEINNYIESLVVNLQKIEQKINVKILTEKLNQYFKENKDV
tara:strand:- start:1128 stop:1337 length:210 start_codon:yes stop_codon:yes gene_type:complete